MTKDEVMEYKIVEHDNPTVFATMVNADILSGWIPLGGVCSISRVGHDGVYRDRYMQAMTRPPKAKPIVIFANGREYRSEAE